MGTTAELYLFGAWSVLCFVLGVLAGAILTYKKQHNKPPLPSKSKPVMAGGGKMDDMEGKKIPKEKRFKA
jgi:hypothetical protein